MPTLNRFPLLGLWAKEAARRAGHRESDARALGHGYAVLFAIRLRKLTEPPREEGKPSRTRRGRTIRIGGDALRAARDHSGRLRVKVGGERPQTAETYRRSVMEKFAPAHYRALQACFREFFKQYSPEALRDGIVYDVYDRWKRACAVGRLVDLDRLLTWCRRQAAKRR